MTLERVLVKLNMRSAKLHEPLGGIESSVRLEYMM